MGSFFSQLFRNSTGYEPPAEDVRIQRDESVRSSCRRCEQQDQEQEERIAVIETLEERLNEANTALKEKEEELNLLQTSKGPKLESSCQQCEEHKESMTEMETFYKQKLNEARSDLKRKEEELKSFKERLAADVAVSIKAADTESINSPVSKTRLTEMYDRLKLLQWPQIKDDLKATEMNPQSAQALLQKTFEDATEEMKKKKKQIEEAFGLTDSNSGPQKVKEYRQLTIQNLQMALYHSTKEDLLQTHVPEHGGQYSKDVMVTLRPLTSQCFWLGCLMALNNPPLQPDWKNLAPGMDPWDIFPRDIKPSSAM
ncbi:uncharacterized protein [Leuresthes tenuis]|uniref:uncharacterized protein isoform X2 n=1 Tax=Leuresthes tenuis TaxID=355514 RepID=UPI003B50474C